MKRAAWVRGRWLVNTSVELLVLKLVIAPVFVGVLSLIALRYGHRSAGWLVALPVNSGTIIFILTLSDGPGFAATVAYGALLGIVSLCAFIIAYARSAARLAWPLCLGLAGLGFVVSTLVLNQLPEFFAADMVAAVAAVAIVLRLVPVGSELDPSPTPPRWEIPLRMLTAALLVLVITTAADALGPRLSGLLSPIPVFTITLVIFTHSRHGPAPVYVFLNGLLYGLFSFAAFCAVVGLLLVPFGLIVSFAAGLLAFVAVYAIIRKVLDLANGRTGSRSNGAS